MYDRVIRLLTFAGLVMVLFAPAAAQADCPLAPRLVAGERGQVVSGGANRIRAHPSADAVVVGQISPGGVFQVRGAPTCADGYYWWPVLANDVMGWTAEGADGVYWLAPYTAPEPTATPAPEVVDNGSVIDLAWSPDGRWLAVATTIGLELYDTTTTEPEPRMLVQDVKINDVIFTPAGEVIAAGDDGFIRAWDATTGEERYQLPHDGAVLSLALSADGARLVSSSAIVQTDENNQVSYSDAVVSLWDMESKAVVHSLRPFHSVGKLQFFDNDQRVALQTEMYPGFSVLLWDMDTDPIWMDGYGPTMGWSLNPSGQQIAISTHLSADGGRVQSLAVIDTQTRQHFVDLDIREDWLIETVAYNPAGDLLLTISNGGRLRIRRTDTLQLLLNLTDTASTVAFSADGQHMAVGGRDGGIRLFSAPVLNSSGQVYIETGHVLFGTVGTVAQVEFSPDSRRVAAVFQDSTVGLWKAAAGEALAEYRREN